MGVYENVKDILDSRGIKVASFEKDLGLAKGGFYKWKDHSPSIKTIKKTSEYLKVPIAKLVK